MSKIMFSRKRKNYAEFSNYHVAPFIYDGIEWNTVEAAFQAQKVLDVKERIEFSKLSAGQAKWAGRRCKLRDDWEQVKFDLMYNICLEKFKQNEDLKQLLLSTEDSLLIEDTTGWHDNIWGYCSCNRCRNSKVKNNLGLILMKVRSQLSGKRNIARFEINNEEVSYDFDSKEFEEIVHTQEGIIGFSNLYRIAK